jgi:hypothetical protein
MIPKKKGKPDLGLYLGIFTTSVGVWYYLFNYIVTLTTDHPADISLPTLGFSHWLVLLVVLLSFVLLVNETSTLAEIKMTTRRSKLTAFCRKFLFSLWGPILFFALISFFCTKLIPENKNGTFVGGIIFWIVSLLAYWIFQFLLGVNISQFIKEKSPFYWLLAFSCIPYSVLVPFMAAGVTFKTEKEFYKRGEIIRFAARPKGYIFLPQIDELDYCGDTIRNGHSEEAHYIDLQKNLALPGGDFIQVSYTPQILPVSRRDFFLLNITEK